MPAQGEVSVVHNNNSQGDPTVPTTVDNVDQTDRVDTSDSDQRPVDDGTTPVQSNKETIIHLEDLPTIATEDYIQDVHASVHPYWCHSTYDYRRWLV